MSDLTTTPLPEFTVHCFWSPRCQHVEKALTPEAAHRAMERHYTEAHEADIKRVVGECR